MKILFDDYIEICDNLEQLPLCTYIPTPDDIFTIFSELDKYIEFLIYISEYHEEPDTEENELLLNAIRLKFKQTIEIID